MDTDTNQIFEELVKNTSSIGQLKRRLPLLKEYWQKLVFSGPATAVGGAPQNAVADLTSEQDDLVWLNSLDPALLRGINQGNINQVLRGLEEKVAQLKPLVTYFSFEMPNEKLAKLVEGLRHPPTGGADRYLLLDVKVDASLVGGCAFVVGGVYHDFSLRKRIQENRGAILEQFTQLFQKQ